LVNPLGTSYNAAKPADSPIQQPEHHNIDPTAASVLSGGLLVTNTNNENESNMSVKKKSEALGNKF